VETPLPVCYFSIGPRYGNNQGELKRFLVVSEGILNCQGKSLALCCASYFCSGEMHSEFGVAEDEAEAFKLVDFVNEV